MAAEKKCEGFTDLSDFTNVDPGRTSSTQNVIKSSNAVSRGIQQVTPADDDPDQPMLFVHREGEQITQIEFRCKCGCSASVRLEYDEQ